MFRLGNQVASIGNMTKPLCDLELAQLASPGVLDSDLVADLAAKVISDMGIEPPIDHHLVASWRGIARIVEADIPWAGCLVREDGDFIAKLRASDPWGRRRFSAFHEIGHTFLPGFAYATQYRCDPGPARLKDRRTKPIEVLSDIAASELLLPRASFCADIVGEPMTLATVEHLAEMYDASLEASAHRLVALSNRPSLLISFEPAYARSRLGEGPRLRVKWVHASGDWPYVPLNKSAPDSSPFQLALDGSTVDKVFDLDGFTSEPLGRVRVSAGLYPYYDHQGGLHQRVLALVTKARQRARNAR